MFIFINASYDYDSTGHQRVDVLYKCESENLLSSVLMIMADHYTFIIKHFQVNFGVCLVKSDTFATHHRWESLCMYNE